MICFEYTACCTIKKVGSEFFLFTPDEIEQYLVDCPSLYIEKLNHLSESGEKALIKFNSTQHPICQNGDRVDNLVFIDNIEILLPPA